MKKLCLFLFVFMPQMIFSQSTIKESSDGTIEKGEMNGDIFTGIIFNPEKGFIYNGSKYTNKKNGKYITGTQINLIKKTRTIYKKGKAENVNSLDPESIDLLNTYYPLYNFHKLKLFDKIDYKDLRNLGEGYVFIPGKNSLKKSKFLWSGNIVNGLLTGKGVGITFIDPNYVYVKCDNFQEGFPTGSLTYRFLKTIWDGAYMKVEDTYYDISTRPDGKFLVSMASDKGNKEFIVNRTGNFVDYSQAQKDREARAFMGFANLVAGVIKVAAVVGAVVDSGSSNSSYSSSNSSSSGSSKKSKDVDEDNSNGNGEQYKESPIDIENIGMPEYKWTSDWKSSSITPHIDKLMGIKDYEHRDLRFTDPEVGNAWIGRSPDHKVYTITSGTKYNSLGNAILAQYVLFKYGKKRETGRVW